MAAVTNVDRMTSLSPPGPRSPCTGLGPLLRCVYPFVFSAISACVRRRSRRTFSTHFEIFWRRVDGVV